MGKAPANPKFDAEIVRLQAMKELNGRRYHTGISREWADETAGSARLTLLPRPDEPRSGGETRPLAVEFYRSDPEWGDLVALYMKKVEREERSVAAAMANLTSAPAE